MNVGIYVDAMNLHSAARVVSASHGFQRALPDYEAVLGECLRVAALYCEPNLIEARIYAASYGSAAFVRALETIGYTVDHHMFRSDKHCKQCGTPKDSWTWGPKIASDILTDALLGDGIGLVVLASGSGKFAPIFERLEECSVVGVAVGYKGTISGRLVRTAELSPKTLYEGKK